MIRPADPADPSDSAFLWQLAMLPDVREMSTRGEAFSLEEHERWYAEKLANGMNAIWVLEQNGQRIGQVRYGRVFRWYPPRINEFEAEIAISICPDFRGEGHATRLLRETEPLAAKRLGVSKFVALVLTKNVLSSLLFTSAGYTWVGIEERMGKVHNRYEKVVE